MQVYMRKGRLLLSLQAVKHALKLAGAAHPDVHRLIVRLCQAVQQQQQQANDDQVKRSMHCFVLHQRSKKKPNKNFLGFMASLFFLFAKRCLMLSLPMILCCICTA